MLSRFIHPIVHKRLLVFLVAVLVISAGLTFWLGRRQANSQAAPEQETFNPEVLSAQAPPSKEELEELKTVNILLLGYGGPGHEGGFLTDVIQLLHIDFEKSQVALISIPRDLWVKLPNGNEAKINQAFTLGEDPNKLVDSGAQVSKAMMSVVSGLEIHYYIAVDFVGFQRAIGQNLDSITVDVPETLEDPWYPIKGEELNPCGMSPDEVAQVSSQYSGFELEKQFECRYEHLYFAQGQVQMEGGDALKYVRSRHGSSGGDFSRSARQHAVLVAIKNKLLKLDAFDDAVGFFKDMTKVVTTDLDQEIVQYLAPFIKLSADYELKTVVLSTDNVFSNSRSSSGQFILVPKQGLGQWGGVQGYIEGELNDN